MPHLQVDRRQTPRSRVFFGGEIIVDAQLPPVECHIKNISQGGVSVAVQGNGLIPYRFELFVRKTGQRQQAVVKHSKGRRLGLAYVTPASTDRSWASLSALRKIPVDSSNQPLK